VATYLSIIGRLPYLDVLVSLVIRYTTVMTLLKMLLRYYNSRFNITAFDIYYLKFQIYYEIFAYN